MRLFAFIAVLVFAISAPGQRTWIVDSRGGPGTDFLDLAPAVAAASPGDTILLVWTWTTPNTWYYHGAVIDKPLRVVGVSEGGTPSRPGRAPFVDRIEIRNIPAGSEVLLSSIYLSMRFDLTPYHIYPHGLVVQNCAGKVHIDSVSYGGGVGVGYGEVRFEDCADLSLHWCDLRQAGQSILFRRSNVAVSDGTFMPSFLGPLCGEPDCIDHTSPTFRVEDCNMRIVDTGILGADYLSYTRNNGPQPPRSAIDMLNSTLLLGTNALLSGGYQNGIPTYAITGTGSVIEDHFAGHTGIQPGIAVQQQRVPAVYMGRVIRNQPFDAWVMGPPNGYALLAIGFPLHQGIALPFGTVAIDPLAMGVMGLGALDYRGAWNQQWQVPPGAPMDLMLSFQAATLTPNGGLGVTWPSVFSISWEGGRTWP